MALKNLFYIKSLSNWDSPVIKGSLVRVPLKAASVIGYVEKIFAEKTVYKFCHKTGTLHT